MIRCGTPSIDLIDVQQQCGHGLAGDHPRSDRPGGDGAVLAQGYGSTSISDISKPLRSTAAASIISSRASRSCWSRCSKSIATGSTQCCSSRAGARWTIRSRRSSPARYVSPAVGRDRLFLWLPDRQPALELHEPDPEVRELIAANFADWTKRVRRLPGRRPGFGDGTDTCRRLGRTGADRRWKAR